MKERPIIFNASDVRAILDGRKTQTRRVVKRHRCSPHLVFLDDGSGWWPFESNDGESAVMGDGCEYPLTCPFGKPGARLWVRENWAWYPLDQDASCVIWRADYQPDANPPAEFGAWKSSANMPRWASRILLEVTAVRVQRLQDISEEEAVAEGCTSAGKGVCGFYVARTARGAFSRDWESIHGPKSWAQNPWVWVIEFRRVEP